MTQSTSSAAAVREHITAIQELFQQAGVTRATLAQAAQRLQKLAQDPTLFPLEAFPPPATAEVGDSTHYLLHAEPDGSYALYLNSINPGKVTPPHNHDTWVLVVAVDGQEINTLYRALDPVQVPGPVRLEPVQTITVAPGGAYVALLDDDIHSIAVVGDRPTRHLHLYGRVLEQLTERVSFDTDTGLVRRYEQHRIKNEQDVRN